MFFSIYNLSTGTMQGTKSQAKSVLTTSLLFYFVIFSNLIVHFVKFFRPFTTEVIENIIDMLSHFISWDGWLYMGPGRVRFQGEVEVSFNSRISCTWHVVSPYLIHLCLVWDGFRRFASGCRCFWGGFRSLLKFLRLL